MCRMPREYHIRIFSVKKNYTPRAKYFKCNIIEVFFSSFKFELIILYALKIVYNP